MRVYKYNKTCDGMYTVEMALLFPIIFFIILFLLNYTFYHYDRSKLQSELEDIVRKASIYMNYEVGLDDNEVDRIAISDKNALSIFFDDHHPKEKRLQQYAVSRLESGFYVMRVKDIEITSALSNVRITGNVNIEFYGYRWINRFFKDHFSLTFNQSAKIFPREEKARLLEVVISYGNQIKGVEETIDQLSKFIGYIH